MNNLRRALLFASLGILLAGCGRGKAPAPAVRSFVRPEIPAMIEDPGERFAWAARNFWDGFLSGEGTTDSTHIAGVPSREVEEAVGLYVSLLGQMPLKEAREAVSGLHDKLSGADSSVFAGVEPLLERYLYDPNSPVRSEDLWGPFAAKLAAAGGSKAEIYAFQARTCALNRTGAPASDFLFTDASGRVRSLYSVSAPLTLLFFSNPGCPACREIIDALAQIGADPSRLAVVNIYIDEDLPAWREHLGDYPRTWITGYDASGAIRNDLLYNVRAIPSLYLLDSDKTVLLKDCTPEALFLALRQRLEE